MRNMKFTRIICLLLALLFLVSTAVVGVSAASADDYTTDKSIEDYVDVLKTISYEKYRELYTEYFSKYEEANTNKLVFDASQGLVFADGRGNKIEVGADSWTMTAKNGTVYDSVDAAVAAGYEKKDLVYVDTFDGVRSIYTPGFGSATWTLDFAAMGVDAAGLYSIELVYYPVEGKAASAEREFSINGEVPFAEVRALQLPKLWSSYQTDGVSGLAATYTLTKKDSLATIEAEAQDAGMKYEVSSDRTSVTFKRPDVMDEKKSKLIEKYELRFFTLDANKNEIRPAVKQTPEWMSYTMRDSEGHYTQAFGFVLEPVDGKVSFTLKGVNEAIALSQIVLTPYDELQTYAEYLEGLKNSNVELSQGSSIIKIEGEDTTHTSTNVVYPVQDNTSALTSPVDPDRTMLNTIGTNSTGAEKWAVPGQWIEYSFKVDSSGLYDICSRFKQSYLDGMYVSRSLYIYTNYTKDQYQSAFQNTAGYYNGIPYEEAAILRFDYNSGWQSSALTAGLDANGDTVRDTYQLYFEKDVEYTIRLEVTLGTMSEQVLHIESILNALNQDYLDIIKLTGTSPDDYRDYSFMRLLPDTLMDMIVQKEELTKVSRFLKETAGVASTYSGICDKLIDLLDRMTHDEDAIAKNLDTFKSYVGSLGTFLTDAKTQPLQIDYITIQPATAEKPVATANFFQAFWHEFRCFIASFYRDYNSMGSMETEGVSANGISVWVPYGRDQANVLRNLTTNKFTSDPKYGIPVDLKLVVGGTLLPSILAGVGPDVYMGLDQGTVINYAIRGALANIETLAYDSVEDFEAAMHTEFNEAAMTVLGIADADGDMHYYGLPETQDFPMMFIRMDILADLDIEEVPRTWDDIYNIQSILEAKNMEIGVTTDYRMFLYQMGGELFADEGMRINLDSQIGLASFEKMCNMFTQYSFPYTYDAANRFRSGEMPIIISGYIALYNKLKVFATELDGCWTFVPLPGFELEDGTFNNESISNVSAVVIIEGTDNMDASWKFLEWQTGADCQVEYANEMVAIIGESAKHSTANRDALESMPWTRDEFEQVSAQFENLASIPNYPGSYIISRYTEFAFLSAYNDDADPRTELLRYINTINNEITRKREEFKLETLEIGQKLSDKRTSQILDALDNLSTKYNSGDKYTDLITAAKYALANAKPDQMENCKALFEQILAKDWEAAGSKTMQITKVNGQVITVNDYYKNVTKQTAEEKNGGYSIDSLNEQQLVYFIAECLQDTADALRSY